MSRVPFFVLLGCLAAGGCMEVSPFDPELRQQIDNQDGQLENLQNNQNGLLLELGRIRQEQQLHAERLNYQQGLYNSTQTNEGVQILQGDGGLLFAVGVVGVLAVVAFHFRNEADRRRRTADLLAQRIAEAGDPAAEEEVFIAALGTDLEKPVYEAMTRGQSKARIRMMSAQRTS